MSAARSVAGPNTIFRSRWMLSFFSRSSVEQKHVPVQQLTQRASDVFAHDGGDLVELGLKVRLIQLDLFRMRLHARTPESSPREVCPDVRGSA